MGALCVGGDLFAFGELGAGEIVLVDATGEGKDDTFTFKGSPRATAPDTLEAETAAIADGIDLGKGE